MVQKLKSSWMKIHRAIHEGKESVEIDGRKLPVEKAPNGCRFVWYNDTDKGTVRIMEQNKNKQSEYAERAKAGETLSWVIPSNGSTWELIEVPVEKEVV